MDCISNGKARVRHAISDKGSIATTTQGVGFVAGMHSLPGTPQDDLALRKMLEPVAGLADQRSDPAVVDRGYRVEATRAVVSGTRCGLTPGHAADLRAGAPSQPGSTR